MSQRLAELPEQLGLGPDVALSALAVQQQAVTGLDFALHSLVGNEHGYVQCLGQNGGMRSGAAALADNAADVFEGGGDKLSGQKLLSHQDEALGFSVAD